jgi:hypothetical protein
MGHYGKRQWAKVPAWSKSISLAVCAFQQAGSQSNVMSQSDRVFALSASDLLESTPITLLTSIGDMILRRI